MSRITAVSGEIIVTSERKADVCVLFYPPYYASELERPAGRDSGLTLVPSAIRRPAFFDGLLKALQLLNVEYDMADLNSATSESLSGYRQVWVFATDEMDARAQEAVAGYMSGGGHAVIFPYLPDRETSQQPCSILRDAVGVVPSGIEIIDSPLIDLLDQQDIKCSNPLVVFSDESLQEAEIIARTINGTPCGFEKSTGKGKVTFIGTWAGFDTEGHRNYYETLLQRAGARLRNTSSENGFLIARERFTSDGRALLFAANYYNEEHTGRVVYTHPVTGENVTIPMASSEITWPPLMAILTPVCMELMEGIRLLHSTSDILGVSLKGNELNINLSGDRDMPGEIILEGTGTPKVSSAELDNLPLRICRKGERVALTYRHEHGPVSLLKIVIS
ncbi:hypothetical protein EG830_08030 [bacterium]|nr:hypothetical protein [bacterium]